MKRLLYMFLLIFVMQTFSSVFSQTVCETRVVVFTNYYYQCDDNPWVLVFEDDFNSNSIDLSYWNPITGVPRDVDFINQKAWHKKENLIVENGLLKVISKNEPQYNMPVVIKWDPYTVKYEDFTYTTGEVWTKRSFLNGIFEARIKIPKGKGFWPAFWLFGGNLWNEIDIFEFWNEYDVWGNYDPNKLSRVHHMNVWFDFNEDGNGDDCPTDYTGFDFSQNFHVYKVMWDKDKIEWYVDGVLKRTDYRYYTMLGQTVGCMINPWTQYQQNRIYPIEPMSVILNTAIQAGNNSPDISTVFPSQMEIDWVRVYQKKQCKNVNITNANQFPLDDQQFNVIVGENVSFNCNYIVPSGQQLNVLAKNISTFGPGFHAQLGSTFNSKTETSICGSSLKNSKSEAQQETFDSQMFRTESHHTTEPHHTKDAFISEEISIMPNPTDGGIFHIDFGNRAYSNYKIVIRDLNGRIISSFEEVNSSILTINLSDQQKGVYVVYLLDFQEKNLTTFKLVLQ